MQWNRIHDIRLTRNQMEERRLLALKDLQNGVRPVDVSEKYGVSRAAVSQWGKTVRDEGREGLLKRKATGRPKKLDEAQRLQLIDILVSGACSSGFETDLWTGKRVAKVIKKEFRIEYHFKHLPKLIRSLGFRLINPKKRAAEQNQSKREYWLNTTWVKVKKK